MPDTDAVSGWARWKPTAREVNLGALFIVACGVAAVVAALMTTAEVTANSEPSGVYSDGGCPPGYYPSSDRTSAAGTTHPGNACLPEAQRQNYARARGAGILGHLGLLTTFFSIAFLLRRRHALWYVAAVLPYLYGTWAVFVLGVFSMRYASLWTPWQLTAGDHPVDPIDDLHRGFATDVIGLLIGACLLFLWLLVRGPWKNRRSHAVQAGVRPVD